LSSSEYVTVADHMPGAGSPRRRFGLRRAGPLEAHAHPLRLVRLRLRLALMTMAIVPMVLALALFRASLREQPTDLDRLILALTIALTAVLAALTVWMTRQVLLPAEELERSRAEMTRMYELARADSLLDGLTGLGNHRAFQEELDRELEWYQRYHVPVALIILDLDDLKLTNDAEGHAAGDDQLRTIGQLITQSTRYADRRGRVRDSHATHGRRGGARDRHAHPRARSPARPRCAANSILGGHLGVSAVRDHTHPALCPGGRCSLLVQAPRPRVG
jgi:GGDEF domain-containing protein